MLIATSAFFEVILARLEHHLPVVDVARMVASYAEPTARIITTAIISGEDSNMDTKLGVYLAPDTDEAFHSAWHKHIVRLIDLACEQFLEYIEEDGGVEATRADVCDYYDRFKVWYLRTNCEFCSGGGLEQEPEEPVWLQSEMGTDYKFSWPEMIFVFGENVSGRGRCFYIRWDWAPVGQDVDIRLH